jgi:hypothetical protein
VLADSSVCLINFDTPVRVTRSLKLFLTFLFLLYNRVDVGGRIEWRVEVARY